MADVSRSVSGTATGTAVTGSGWLLSVGLCGGADAATIVVRNGGSGGVVMCKLGVGAGLSDSRVFGGDNRFVGDLHITVTGTTPTWDVEVA